MLDPSKLRLVKPPSADQSAVDRSQPQGRKETKAQVRATAKFRVGVEALSAIKTVEQALALGEKEFTLEAFQARIGIGTNVLYSNGEERGALRIRAVKENERILALLEAPEVRPGAPKRGRPVTAAAKEIRRLMVEVERLKSLMFQRDLDIAKALRKIERLVNALKNPGKLEGKEIVSILRDD